MESNSVSIVDDLTQKNVEYVQDVPVALCLACAKHTL